MIIRVVILTVLAAVGFVAAAAPSPWDSWRAGYTSFEQGESLRERGRYSEALKMFEKSKRSYLAVRAARPDWNQRVIADRLRDCEKQLREVRRLLGVDSDAVAEKTVAVADKSSETEVTAEHSEAKNDNAEITVLQRELYQLKAELSHNRQLLQKQRNFETEMAALLRDRRVAEEKLALLEKRYRDLQQEKNTAGFNNADIEQRLISEKMISERFRKRLAAVEQQLADVQQQLKEAQLFRSAAEKQVMQKAEELKRSEVEISQLREENSRAVTRVKNMSETTAVDSVLKKELEEIAAAYRNSRKMLEQREQELRQVKNELQQQRSEANISATEIANLRTRNKTLEEDVKRFSDQVTDLELRLERRNSADFRTAAAAKQTREKLENEILNLQKELITLRGKLDTANASVADAERKTKSLNAELLSLRASVSQSETDMKDLKNENRKLQKLNADYARLKRDFNALAAENRENKILAEAAKPREAELERAKLMLLEMDRLKRDLTREQRLSAELKETHNRDQNELRTLRGRAAEFDAARRRLVELEAASKEIGRLQEVEKELINIRGREAELAQVKIHLGELNSLLRQRDVAAAELKKIIAKQEKQLIELKDVRADLERSQRSNDEFKAMIANQNSELDRLNSALKQSGSAASSSVDKAELQKYRELAGQLGPLNDRLYRLREENAAEEKKLRSRIESLEREEQRLKRDLQLQSRELAELKKINADLADYRKNSAASLREKVDISRLNRLDNELAALNKLNAEMVAERDKLLAELEQLRNGAENIETEKLPPAVAPEQAASNGMIAEKEGKIELAIWNYQQALAGDDKLASVHFRLGVLLARRGSFDQAIPHLSQSFALYPSNIEAALYLVRCYLELKRFGNAQSVIEPLLSKNSENGMVQMYAALTDAGSGNMVRAEERLQTALRLEPQNAVIHLEMAKLLAASVADRRQEAALAYETARILGCEPEPHLESKLGSLLDHRRELVRFMSSAAREAELNKDWISAVWYYKKIVAEKHPEYVPFLALAQWKSGNISGAKETLEFHKPSRLGMVVLTMIALEEKDENAALRFAQQSTGAKIPPEWVGINLELARLKNDWFNSSAAKLLLRGINR